MRGKTFRIRRTIEYDNGSIVFSTLFDSMMVEVYVNLKMLHTEVLAYGLDDSINLVSLIEKLSRNYLLMNEKGDYYTILIDKSSEPCIFTVRPGETHGVEILFQLRSNKYSDILMDIAYDDVYQILGTCYNIAMCG